MTLKAGLQGLRAWFRSPSPTLFIPCSDLLSGSCFTLRVLHPLSRMQPFRLCSRSLPPGPDLGCGSRYCLKIVVECIRVSGLVLPLSRSPSVSPSDSSLTVVAASRFDTLWDTVADS